MRILLLTHAYNGLAQRLHVELRALGHTVSVEFDINDDVTREALPLFRPDYVVGTSMGAMIGAASSGTKWRSRSEGVSRGRTCIAAAVVLWDLTNGGNLTRSGARRR